MSVSTFRYFFPYLSRPHTPCLPSIALTSLPLLTVERAFELFRTLGLRHLIVINDCHDVVGIITRHELLLSHLEACARERLKRRAGVE